MSDCAGILAVEGRVEAECEVARVGLRRDVGVLGPLVVMGVHANVADELLDSGA